VFLNLSIKMKKSQLFLILNLLFIAGIIAGILVDVFYLYIAFLFLIIGLFLFYRRHIIKIILLGFCFFILGIWRYNIDLQKVDEGKINFYNNSEIEFVGIVEKEPDIRNSYTNLTVESQRLAGNKLVYGKVLVMTNIFPEFAYGDELKIICRLQAPENFNDFAYDKYLARYDIYSLCYYPKIKLLKRNQGSEFYAKTYYLKSNLKLIIEQSLHEPHSSLLSAIILGVKRGIPKELVENFSQAGISHIMAISGMHITILATLLLYLGIMIGLSRDRAFYFATIGLFLYILLIGFPASAVRAGIMGFLVLWAMKLGRLNKATNAVVFAASVMLLINPLLIYDIGFQLSFLAVVGLIYIFPILEKVTKRVPDFFKLKSLILITISAQISTLPVILYHFGRFSLIAPLANILVVPLLPLIMILGLVLLLGGLIWGWLSQVIGWLMWLVLSYVIWAVDFLAGFKFSGFEIKITGLMVVLLYVVIILSLRIINKKTTNK